MNIIALVKQPPDTAKLSRTLNGLQLMAAGQPRIVDTEKRGQDFLPATGIQGGFRHLHDELKGENFLRGLDPEKFGDRLTRYWYCIYAVHVFRDGNSRAMRHFFAALASS